jgi:hypothetical protein
MMTEELTKTIIAWATEVGSHAATLSSQQARDSYLAQRRDELTAGAVAQGTSENDAAVLADACVSAAQRIMTELMVQRAGEPQGRA